MSSTQRRPECFRERPEDKGWGWFELRLKLKLRTRTEENRTARPLIKKWGFLFALEEAVIETNFIDYKTNPFSVLFALLSRLEPELEPELEPAPALALRLLLTQLRCALDPGLRSRRIVAGKSRRDAATQVSSPRIASLPNETSARLSATISVA